MCDQCKVLQAEIKRLERENAKLKRLVKFAKRVIKTQRRQLDDIMYFCLDIIRQGKKTMSQHVPRGTWSLWKGKREVAEDVYDRAKVNYAARFLELLAEFDL